MKIYTKTGDGGETGLFAGPRVLKDHARIEAYGDVDELNSMLGWTRCELSKSDLDSLLRTIQNQLFSIGSELATPDHGKQQHAVGTAEIKLLEQAIDALVAELRPLTQFILPGGSRGAAALHMARTVCRRAERRVVTLSLADDLGESHALEYLNRLSDLLFVMARAANARAAVEDVAWSQPSG